MSRVYICDVCSKEISRKNLNKFTRNFINFWGDDQYKRFDICNKCLDFIKRSVKNDNR